MIHYKKEEYKIKNISQGGTDRISSSLLSENYYENIN